MKRCPSCAAENENASRFCIRCGFPLDSVPAQPPVQPPFQQVPPVTYQEYPYTPYSPYEQVEVPTSYASYADTVAQRIQKLFSSPQALAVVILWFVLLFLNILSGFSSARVVVDSSSLRINSNGIALFGSIEIILIGIGMALIYGTARSRSGQQPMSLSGFSLLRAGVVVSLVFTCIRVLFLLIIGVLCIAGQSNIMYYFGNILKQAGVLDIIKNSSVNTVTFARIIGVSIVIGSVIGGAASVIFSVLVLKFVGGVTESLRMDVFVDRFARPLSILFYVLSGISILTVFGSFAAMVTNPVGGLLSFLVAATSIVIYLLLGSLIMKYYKLNTVPRY